MLAKPVQHKERIKTNTKRYTLTSLRLVPILLATLLAACSGSAPAKSTVAPATPQAGLANPASVFCAEKGGKVNITTDASGGQIGVCVFPDGSQCEEWAFYRGQCTPVKPSQATTTTPAAGPASLTEAVLKNAKYDLPDIGAAQLKDGAFEHKYGDGTTQVNKVGYTQAVLGDLNGDKADDAAVVLWANTGGSGTFIYLIVATNQNGAPQQVAAQLLGDRIKVQNLAVQNGQIVINALSFGQNDPMCCPSQLVIRTYRLQGNALQVVSEVRPTSLPQPSNTPQSSDATNVTQVIVFDPRSFKIDLGREPLKAMCEASVVVPRTDAYKCATAAGGNFDPCFVVEGNMLVCNPNLVRGSYSLVTATNPLPKGGSTQDKPVAFFLELAPRNPPCVKRADLNKELASKPVTYSCEAPGAWIVGDLDTSQPMWVVQYIITDSAGTTVTFGPTPVNVVRAWVY